MNKICFYIFVLVGFFLPGCQRSDSSNDTFSAETPSTTATFIVPTGTAAQANPDLPYSFSVTISGVNGTGELRGSFVNATGSVNFTGLDIVFSSFTETAFLTYQSTGTVSGPFTGNGTVSIELIYGESGIIVFDNVVDFEVTIQKLSYRSEDTPVGGVGDRVSSINVPFGLSAITDVRVRVQLLTDFPLLLNLTLVSPNTTQVNLLSGTGLLSDPNMAVIFDDVALLDITTDFAGNTPPPFLAFRPEGSLSAFDGEDPSGNWALSINDGYYGLYAGSLVEWVLAFNGETSIIDSSPTSLPPLSYSAGALSVAIDNLLPPVQSTITVPAGVPSISDLRVRLDVIHTAVGDLRVTLTSPSGIIIDLSMNNGGAGDDMQVILDDDAIGSTMAANFVGSSGSAFTAYVPIELLAGVNGRNPAGSWRLTITDGLPGDTGTLNGWALAFNGDENIFVDF
ncbi:MAG: proprotein convertase P-domain-containing protein [Planctomycetota bacterium]